MRKIFLALVFLYSFASHAQENNPYNTKGIDYVASIKLITDDFKASRVKDFNEESLNYYSKAIPLENDINIEVATKVIQTLKSDNLNFSEMIDNSTLPDFSKRTFRNLYEKSKKLNRVDFLNFLRDEVELISATTIEKQEKESLLTFVAVLYNAVQSRNGCSGTVTGPNGTVTDTSGTVCILIGIGVGFLIGDAICGPLCGIGGAIIGGIVGSLT